MEVDFHKLYADVYGDWSYASSDPVDPKKTALVIIDAQPAFVDSTVGYMKAYFKTIPASPDYFEHRVREIALPNINRLLDFYRARKLLIAYVITYSETEDLSDMDAVWTRAIRKWEKVLGEQIWRRWNEGMGFCPEIAPLPHELVLNKRTSSAFATSVLPLVLKNAGIETVVLAGFNTNGCVFETACVGSNLGYDFIVPCDATACFAPTLQAEAETWLAKHFANVSTTDETIALLEAWKGK